jgi:hypothetical protein
MLVHRLGVNHVISRAEMALHILDTAINRHSHNTYREFLAAVVVGGLTALPILCGAAAVEALDTIGLLKRSAGRTVGWIGEGASAALVFVVWPLW